MKVAFFEISLRLEDFFNLKLKSTSFSEYEIFFSDDLLEKGMIYESIMLKNDSSVATTSQNEELFWNIVKTLEQNRTIEEHYKRMHVVIEKNAPELFLEDVEIPIIGGINEYIIYLAILSLLAVLLFKFILN